MKQPLTNFRRVVVALLGVVALALAACGNGSSESASESAVEFEPDEVEAISQERTKPSGPPWEPSPVEIDASVWYGGFEIVIEAARITIDPPDDDVDEADDHRPTHGTVEIDLLVTNPGDQALAPSGQFMLEAAGVHHPATSIDLPTVPAGGSGRGSLSFRVEAGFVFEDAVLTIGGPDERNVVVSLGGEGALVSNEPVILSIDASGGSEDTVVDVVSGRIEASERYRPLPLGSALLTLHMDVTYSGSNRTVGLLVAGTAISLQLPDGTAIAPENFALRTYVNSGTTERGLELSFTIDDPPAGDYVLLVATAPAGERVEIPVPFTIP